MSRIILALALVGVAGPALAQAGADAVAPTAAVRLLLDPDPMVEVKSSDTTGIEVVLPSALFIHLETMAEDGGSGLASVQLTVRVRANCRSASGLTTTRESLWSRDNADPGLPVKRNAAIDINLAREVGGLCGSGRLTGGELVATGRAVDDAGNVATTPELVLLLPDRAS